MYSKHLYVVVQEHTLGVMYPNGLQILRSLYRKGGYLESQCPAVAPSPEPGTYRPATPDDEETFRVSLPASVFA